MFDICAIFHQMISLNDTTLKWGFDIFRVEKISRCVDTGFESILCKCNRGLLITFFFFPWHFWYLIVWYFYEVLNFPGTSFLISEFKWYFVFWRSFFISTFLRYYTFYMPVVLQDFPNALLPFFVCSGFQIFLFAIISYWFALIMISLFNCLLFFLFLIVVIFFG